jgi:hypothetical protein
MVSLLASRPLAWVDYFTPWSLLIPPDVLRSAYAKMLSNQAGAEHLLICRLLVHALHTVFAYHPSRLRGIESHFLLHVVPRSTTSLSWTREYVNGGIQNASAASYARSTKAVAPNTRGSEFLFLPKSIYIDPSFAAFQFYHKETPRCRPPPP